ncbi:MAG: transporter associated domain-containing protein [Psittacicella sp.]
MFFNNKEKDIVKDVEFIKKEDLLKIVYKAKKDKTVDIQTLNMLKGVLSISDSKVRNLMMPRSNLVFLEDNFSLEECVKIILDSGYSRFPVVDSTFTKIKGALLAKDLLIHLLEKDKVFEIKNFIRDPIVVPESKPLDKMLNLFYEERFHMAIVVDEFGLISGIITMEDILEEIVGEIRDEYDDEEDDNIKKLSTHSYLVRSIMDLDDFNDAFKTSFKEDDVNTIGGYLVQQFGYLPKKDEYIVLNGIKFQVFQRDNKRIIQIRLKVPDKFIPII